MLTPFELLSSLLVAILTLVIIALEQNHKRDIKERDRKTNSLWLNLGMYEAAFNYELDRRQTINLFSLVKSFRRNHDDEFNTGFNSVYEEIKKAEGENGKTLSAFEFWKKKNWH